jgi:DsbC/DsbD-like thiol-disulfide interchange protein
MKKVIVLVLGLVLLNIAVHAQIVKPASWSFSASPVKGKTGIYEVHLTATIQDGWTIYSQWTPADGPEPTVIKFSPNSNVLLGGKAKELGAKKVKHEEVFGVDVHYFEKKVDFVQIVKLKSAKGDKVIKGKINYMTCDKNQCITDEVEFNIPLK